MYQFARLGEQGKAVKTMGAWDGRRILASIPPVPILTDLDGDGNGRRPVRMNERTWDNILQRYHCLFREPLVAISGVVVLTQTEIIGTATGK